MNSLARWAIVILVGVAAALMASYLLDTAVFLLRPCFHSQPLDAVRISTTAAIPLKSGKTDLESEGSIVVSCSRTLYPQGSYQPCWYLRSHASQIDHF